MLVLVSGSTVTPAHLVVLSPSGTVRGAKVPHRSETSGPREVLRLTPPTKDHISLVVPQTRTWTLNLYRGMV